MRRGQWFFAENVLPELDSPGEWYLDRATSLLYFWPPAPLDAGQTVVSIVRDPFRVTGAAHLSFEGLLIETGRGSGIVIRDGQDVRVAGCTIRNMGNWGVKVHGGHGHGVVDSEFYQTGQGGIHLEGGDRKSLMPGGHYAENNHVHHTARWDPVYQQGITAFGVGNRVTHNLIDHVPHVAIGFGGNEQVIEFNEIHHDYKQPPWSTRYPELLNILEDEPRAPKGNVVARNICWGGKWGWTEPKAEPFVAFKDNLLDTDPRFKDQARYQLEEYSPAFKLEFQAIPFAKIGRSRR